MLARFNDFHNKINADAALKEELQELKNKVFMSALTEKEQLAFLETNMIPFAKRLGIDFSMEEIRHFIEKQEGVNEFPEDDFKTYGIGMSASDVLHHFFNDDKQKNE